MCVTAGATRPATITAGCPGAGAALKPPLPPTIICPPRSRTLCGLAIGSFDQPAPTKWRCAVQESPSLANVAIVTTGRGAMVPSGSREYSRNNTTAHPAAVQEATGIDIV